IPEDYLPRTNYVPACTLTEFRARAPKIPWDEGARSTDYMRLLCNRGLGVGGERTLQPAFAPPQAAHILSAYSYAFRDTRILGATATTWSSIPIDFFMKVTAAGDFVPNVARRLPIVGAAPGALARTL